MAAGGFCSKKRESRSNRSISWVICCCIESTGGLATTCCCCCLPPRGRWGIPPARWCRCRFPTVETEISSAITMIWIDPCIRLPYVERECNQRGGGWLELVIRATVWLSTSRIFKNILGRTGGETCPEIRDWWMIQMFSPSWSNKWNANRMRGQFLCFGWRCGTWCGKTHRAMYIPTSNSLVGLLAPCGREERVSKKSRGEEETLTKYFLT